MKRFGLLIIGLALFVACSKDEEKELVDNSEPAVPMTNYVMTGVFEGEWDNMTEPTKALTKEAQRVIFHLLFSQKYQKNH